MNKFALAPVAILASIGSAHAAMPAGVEEALSSIGTDSVSLATIILLAIVAVFAVKFLRKGL